MTAVYSNRRKLHEVLISETHRIEEESYRVQNIVNRAKALKLPIKYLPKVEFERIEKYAQNQPHQGVILKCEPLKHKKIQSIEELTLKKKNGSVLIFVDQVTDPQNFGAIIRAAAFLGVDGIVTADENKCPLTPTVSKTSSGALELVDIYAAKDSVDFIKDCVENNWRVIGTTLEKGNPKLKEITDLQLNPDDNVIVLFGSEHLGLRKPLIQNSTDLVYIKSGIPEELNKFPYTLLDSLNVSVSCGIIVKIIKEKLNGVKI